MCCGSNGNDFRIKRWNHNTSANFRVSQFHEMLECFHESRATFCQMMVPAGVSWWCHIADSAVRDAAY